MTKLRRASRAVPRCPYTEALALGAWQQRVEVLRSLHLRPAPYKRERLRSTAGKQLCLTHPL